MGRHREPTSKAGIEPAFVRIEGAAVRTTPANEEDPR